MLNNRSSGQIMGKVVNFPCSFEDEIRINNATKWIALESKFFFTKDKEYPLFYNEWTEEYYIIDDLGQKDFAFCIACKGKLA